jgi:NAD/NADP transhydrogenase alpha subunit
MSVTNAISSVIVVGAQRWFGLFEQQLTPR